MNRFKLSKHLDCGTNPLMILLCIIKNIIRIHNLYKHLHNQTPTTEKSFATKLNCSISQMLTITRN